MSTKLNALNLGKLPEGTYRDHLLPGLEFRVRKRRRVWNARPGGDTRIPLGFFVDGGPDTMGLAEAREACRALMLRRDQGVPLNAPVVTAPGQGITLGQLFDKYEIKRGRSGYRIKSLPRSMATLRRGFAKWLNLPVAKLTKRDLKDARDLISLEGKKIRIGEKLLELVQPVLSWAVEEGWLDHNPAKDIKRQPSNKRQRVLSETEIKLIWQALPAVFKGKERTGSWDSYVRLIRFLIVTGTRLDEAVSLTYGKILDGVWTQRPEDNKSNRQFKVTLPPLARELVGQGEPRALVFPAWDGGKLNSHAYVKERLDELTGIEDWVFHDFRRSLASHLSERDLASEGDIDLLLNHGRRGVLGVYQRAPREKQKAAALQAWADLVVSWADARPSLHVV